MKKIIFIVLIIILFNFTACTNIQEYDSAKTSTYTATYSDEESTSDGGIRPILTVWKVIKLPVSFLLGIPKATLNIFENFFNSAEMERTTME